MHSSIYVFILAALALFASVAQAAAPPAGATIGNQASASYSDSSSVTRSVTSNTVVTVVQQVASLTLDANSAQKSSAGGQVSYPHTITNTGNGTDTFTLVNGAQTSTFSFTSVAFYADANGDGVPDNSTPITSTGEVAAGGIFKFVVIGTVPNTVVTGNSNTMTVTAASVLTPAVTQSNTDITTITTQGVINVTQGLDVTYGPAPAGPRTITLIYANTGNTTATNVKLTDLIPNGMTYVPASARWSVTGSGTVLTDASNADNQSGIVYDYDISTSRTVTATIASVAPGASATITFQVNVNSALAPGANATTALTATYAYNDGATNLPAVNTNAVQYTVQQTAAVAVSSPTAVPSAVQGATVSFTNVVTNNGNGTDSFNVSLPTSSFPAGTTFQLFRADGVTPLTDTNGDGLPDTGPVSAGGNASIVVKATLPGTVSGGGAYTVGVRGTSVFDGTKLGNGTDTLTTIAANSVDLTNDTAGVGALGAGAGPEASPVTTYTVSAGNTQRVTLVIANNSSIADNFNLAASTDATFASNTIPAGWTVVFHDASGAVVSNTGVIGAGGVRTVYADITAPTNATTGFDLYFRSLSPSSGIGDKLHDAIAVGTSRNLIVTPNNIGQTVPGGTIVYTHTIVNTGTATEGAGASTVTLSTSNAAGFTSAVYWDKNNNGVLDASDPTLSDLASLTGGTNGASTAAGLSPGETATLFVKVTAPPGAVNALTNTTTLTASVTGVISGIAAPSPATANDATTVIVSNVTLVKKQALDANCDGAAEGSFTTAALGAGATPGSCIRYQITATNVGGSDILSLVVSDATPANTTYHIASPAASTVGTVAAPASGASGSIQATVGTLTSGQSAVLTFGVRINP